MPWAWLFAHNSLNAMAVDLQDQPGPLLSWQIQNNCLALIGSGKNSLSGIQWWNMVTVTCLYVLKYLTCKVALESVGNCLVTNICQDTTAPSTIAFSDN